MQRNERAIYRRGECQAMPLIFSLAISAEAYLCLIETTLEKASVV